MDFKTRYKKLNAEQKAAVDAIDGPLLVVAGPGTGKTELLSMRAANILAQTDTLPSAILCLTFTDSGAAAMRERLREIIGADAYKVAIHTFHSFGTEVIGQNAEYFYHGARMKPADELAQYEIMREIFDELDYKNPLAGKNGEEYTYLRDALQAISELKRSGLTSDELRIVIDDVERVIDAVESDIREVFSDKISKKTAERLAPIAEKAAALEENPLPPAITPYLNVLSLSIAHAIDAALQANSTKPITAWKNAWCEKNDKGEIISKDRKAIERLRAVAHIYYQYISRLEAGGLFDYDDMILQVVHALETHPDLAANLREKYLYIMVDEFQDTNLAQLRILFDLTTKNEHPNIMAVGDDDQGIYSFQGADVSNIHRFRHAYTGPNTIVLTDNYRSSTPILDLSRRTILQADSRLEQTMDLNKQLTSHHRSTKKPTLHAYHTPDAERAAVARQIAQLIADGEAPESITVLARKHSELIAIAPYLIEQGIHINYERRDNVLDHPLIRLLEHLLLIIDAIHTGEHERADSLLPEILGHPAFGYDPYDVWRLSLDAHRAHAGWLETMATSSTFQPLAAWLIDMAAHIHDRSLEEQIDRVIGLPTSDSDDEKAVYSSRLYSYFFSQKKRAEAADTYLESLEALRTIRDRLRDHTDSGAPSVASFLDFLAAHHELGSTITSIRRRADTMPGLINLMTAHKAKGLEYDHVFVIGLTDNTWGERVRSRSRLIRYPANLQIATPGDNYDERIRLAYVAMTRARSDLRLSYAVSDAAGKDTLVASFLSGITETIEPSRSISQLTAEVETDWRGRLTKVISPDMRTLLMPTLEQYKLSATHIGNFLDVSRGGPEHFLQTNLLRFPQAKSAAASYGTAIHATLQQAHDYVRANQSTQPLEDIIGNFERILREQYLTERENELYLSRGIDALNTYLAAHYQYFNASQRTELNFATQNVVVGDARLTGALDLADIDERSRTIRVTDYKTGRAARDWKGTTDYEKIKLHKYRQQLMFYQLLVEGSRDYSKYSFDGGVLQFVEPTQTGDIISLEQRFNADELDEFRRLVQVIWQRILALDLPDISGYEPNYKGMVAFEADLLR